MGRRKRTEKSEELCRGVSMSRKKKETKVRVQFELYKKSLSDFLVNNEVLTPEKTKEVMAEITEYVGTHLECIRCSRVLTDSSFYKCKSQPSRRHRYPVCRACYRDYLEGKPYEKDADNRK